MRGEPLPSPTASATPLIRQMGLEGSLQNSWSLLDTASSYDVTCNEMGGAGMERLILMLSYSNSSPDKMDTLVSVPFQVEMGVDWEVSGQVPVPCTPPQRPGMGMGHIERQI